MSNIMQVIPEAEGDEALYLNKITQGLTIEQLNQFSNTYRSRRKDPQIILITCLVGFISIAGIHRFMLNQIGMGLLYLFTGGLCLIGTIVDLVNYKDLAFRYNREVAKEIRSYL